MTFALAKLETKPVLANLWKRGDGVVEWEWTKIPLSRFIESHCNKDDVTKFFDAALCEMELWSDAYNSAPFSYVDPCPPFSNGPLDLIHFVRERLIEIERARLPLYIEMGDDNLRYFPEIDEVNGIQYSYNWEHDLSSDIWYFEFQIEREHYIILTNGSSPECYVVDEWAEFLMGQRCEYSIIHQNKDQDDYQEFYHLSDLKKWMTENKLSFSFPKEINWSHQRTAEIDVNSIGINELGYALHV